MLPGSWTTPVLDPSLLDDWAASRPLLQFLYRHIRRTKPQLILECGSGLSTVIMAEALRRNGTGNLVSLEHHVLFYDRSCRLLIEHGLDTWASIRFAPLRNGWYDAELPEGFIDLMLVDGPPGAALRYPALSKVNGRVGMVVLDDANREGEREVLARWQAQYPEYQLELIPHPRGTAVLTPLTVRAAT